MYNKILRIIQNPLRFIRVLGERQLLNWVPDKLYLKLVYRGEMGEKLNLDNPQTFNEKLQWLKLYDRKPEYSIYVDKYEVRKYIAKTIGDEYLIPIIGVYESVEDIQWGELPKRFALKCTHGSGSNIICQNKNELDINDAKKKLNKWMNKNWYWYGREWPYKNVKPRIICEELIETKAGKLPNDYKFHCFNGEPDNVMVCTERDSGDTKFFFFDSEWNLLRYNLAGKSVPQNFTLPKPKKLNEMFEIARVLSAKIPFVRVDLYCEEEKIYFGELTFFPRSGFDENLLRTTDLFFGGKIKLNNVNT